MYYFQNPNTGYPMILTTDALGRIVVECEDADDYQSPAAEDAADAARYTGLVAGFASMGDDKHKQLAAAALHLKVVIGAKDILD